MHTAHCLLQENSEDNSVVTRQPAVWLPPPLSLAVDWPSTCLGSREGLRATLVSRYSCVWCAPWHGPYQDSQVIFAIRINNIYIMFTLPWICILHFLLSYLLVRLWNVLATRNCFLLSDEHYSSTSCWFSSIPSTSTAPSLLTCSHTSLSSTRMMKGSRGRGRDSFGTVIKSSPRRLIARIVCRLKPQVTLVYPSTFYVLSSAITSLSRSAT